MSKDQPNSPADRYESEMVPAMFRPFAEELVSRLTLRNGMRIADVGCGTGIVARLVGERLDATSTVVGVDINAGMLSVARSKSKPSVCKFEWHQASADAMPLEDSSIDLVVSQHAFMLFPDKIAATKEMYRVLRAGGSLQISAWRHFSHQPHYASLIEGLGELVSVEAADLMKSPFLFEADEELRSLIKSGGFGDVGVENVKMNVRFTSSEMFVRTIVAGSILARMGIQLSEIVLEKLCSFVANALARYSSASGLVVPMESYVATSIK